MRATNDPRTHRPHFNLICCWMSVSSLCGGGVMLTDEQLAKHYGMTVEELKRWQEIRNRQPIRIEELAGIPRDEIRRKYKADHPHIDAMQGEVHEGEQDI